jgi:hypothetical protein
VRYDAELASLQPTDIIETIAGRVDIWRRDHAWLVTWIADDPLNPRPVWTVDPSAHGGRHGESIEALREWGELPRSKLGLEKLFALDEVSRRAGSSAGEDDPVALWRPGGLTVRPSRVVRRRLFARADAHREARAFALASPRAGLA